MGAAEAGAEAADGPEAASETDAGSENDDGPVEDTPAGGDAEPAPVRSPGRSEAERLAESNEASSPVTSALGTLTVLGAAAGLAGLGMWLERNDTVDACLRFERADPPTSGCVNLPSIRDQRDVALGLAIGLGAVTLGAGIAWIIAAVTGAGADADETHGPDPEAASARCLPGLFGVACRGRF